MCAVILVQNRGLSQHKRTGTKSSRYQIAARGGAVRQMGASPVVHTRCQGPWARGPTPGRSSEHQMGGAARQPCTKSTGGPSLGPDSATRSVTPVVPSCGAAQRQAAPNHRAQLQLFQDSNDTGANSRMQTDAVRARARVAACGMRQSRRQFEDQPAPALVLAIGASASRSTRVPVRDCTATECWPVACAWARSTLIMRSVTPATGLAVASSSCCGGGAAATIAIGNRDRRRADVSPPLA